jgi:hypothetical protein
MELSGIAFTAEGALSLSGECKIILKEGKCGE